MSLHRWLQNLRAALGPGHYHQRVPRRGARRRLNVEVLEDRCVPAQYAVDYLGISAADLNEAGQIVGSVNAGIGSAHAALADNENYIDLGTLGGTSSYASGINDLGQVVGYAYLPGDASFHAFLITPQGGAWFRDSDLDGRNDLMIDLGTLPGSDYSSAAAINNAGQVVGSSGGGAFLWDAANGMVSLGAGFASAINEVGQVAGITDPGLPFLWDAVNGMTVLDPGPGYLFWGSAVQDPAPGYPWARAVSINDAGWIVGTLGVDSGLGYAAYQEAFLWDGHYFSSPLYGDSSGAYDINNSGQVVGSIVTSDYFDYGVQSYHAALGGGGGAATFLQYPLLDCDVTLECAYAINDHGVILAGGYLLTPVPDTPTLRIADAPAVTEGNTGTRAATFTVTLSPASSETITVAYATADEGATAGSDYQAVSGTLTFASFETSKTITVQVIADLIPERDEWFLVNLSSPTNAIIADGEAWGAIIDDDPNVSVSDASVAEGNEGARSVSFTVTLSAPYYRPVTVNYSTADGTATAGSDYQAVSGTLTFASFETSKTITVQIIGDRRFESNETFAVNLSSPTNAIIADGQGIGTITDDEPRISISDVTAKEGNGKKTTLFTFTVTLSAAYDQPVTMSFKTTDGTAKTSDIDYVAKTGTLTFNPGETTKTITIGVNGDSKKEANETFYLDLFGNSSNSLFTKNRGIGTILNDD